MTHVVYMKCITIKDQVEFSKLMYIVMCVMFLSHFRAVNHSKPIFKENTTCIAFLEKWKVFFDSFLLQVAKFHDESARAIAFGVVVGASSR